MYKSPFYVALDHTKKTVVVVIRGTLSLQVSTDNTFCLYLMQFTCTVTFLYSQ